MNEPLYYIATCPNARCDMLAYKWRKRGDSCRCGWGSTPGDAVYANDVDITVHVNER